MSEFPVQNPCPICRLPPEILSEIFYRSLLEDAPTSPLIQSATDWALRRNASWGAIQGPRENKEVIQNTGVPQRSLALVCSAWRTLVYSTPTLWTIFKAEFARVPTAEALHRIHNSLSRAKSLPLHIYITAHDTNIPERSPILMEILSPFLSQIQFLALDMSFNLTMSLLGSTALDSGRIVLPLLEELRLEEMWPLSSGGGDPDIPWKLQLSGSQETFFIHRSPHLRRLVLTSPGLGFIQRAIRNTRAGIPWGQLTSIHVKRWHLSVILQLFQLCPNLVDIHIAGMAGSSNVTSRLTMRLVQQFSCGTAMTPLRLLARISLPAMKSLRLTQFPYKPGFMRDTSEAAVVEELIRLHRYDPFQLQCLDISGLEFLGSHGSNRSQVIEFLSLIPTLVELRLEEDVLLDRGFMQALTYDPENASACLLPSLKQIYLAYHECERVATGGREDVARTEWVDSGWFLDMIESRRSEGCASHGEPVTQLDGAEFRLYDSARPKKIWFQRVADLRKRGLRLEAAWIRGMRSGSQRLEDLQQVAYTPDQPPNNGDPSWDDLDDSMRNLSII